MSDTPKEDFYDTEIAPVLLELSKKCSEKGILLVAAVEFERGVGKTYSGGKPESADMALVTAAAKAQGNLDLMVMSLARSSFAEGHNSVVLELFGKDRND